MTTRVRIGAVAYLNAKPLVRGLELGLGSERIELTHAVPSALAACLAAGQLDIALLPSIELARIPDLTVVPGIGISSRGPAASVLLVTRKALADVRSVALDPDSRTSNALVQILFADVWGGSPEFVAGAPALERALELHDAAVRIGDKALFGAIPASCEAIDLGEAWTRRTGLPFVFAVWAARPGVLDREIYMLLHESRRRGTASRERIAADYLWEGRSWPERSLEYLTRRIFFRLGAPEVEGLERFLEAAHRLGIVPRPTALRLARFTETACDTPEPGRAVPVEHDR